MTGSSPTLKLSSSKSKLSYETVGKSLAKSKKIIIVTGAGVSVSAGIPDFRSTQGLYNLVKQRYPGVVFKGQELFDASLFKDETKKRMFYHFIASLKMKSAEAQATRTHSWFKELQEMGVLGRVYTQNIDDLDKKAGLTTGYGKHSHAVQLHGDLDTVHCTLCKHSQAFDDDLVKAFHDGQWPHCPSCTIFCEDRVKNGKRSVAVGYLRPGIVLYNEHHTKGDLISELQSHDMSRKAPMVDALIVIGTSLKIHGLKNLIKSFSDLVHSKPGGVCIFINLTPPSSQWNSTFDHVLLGPCDDSVAAISEIIKRVKNEEEKKKTTRKIAKEKKEEKERKEKKSTTNITQYFKSSKATSVTVSSTSVSSVPIKSKKPLEETDKFNQLAKSFQSPVKTVHSRSNSSSTVSSFKSKLPTPVRNKVIKPEPVSPTKKQKKIILSSN